MRECSTALNVQVWRRRAMGPVFRGIRKHPPLYQGLSEADGNAQGFALVETEYNVLFCRQGKKKLSVCVARHRVLPRQSTTGEAMQSGGGSWSKVCYGYNDPSGNMCNCHICSACSKNGQVWVRVQKGVRLELGLMSSCRSPGYHHYIIIIIKCVVRGIAP